MSRSEDMPVPLGTVLDEKYHVERVIGRGGMAVVYEGQHLALERTVAIKVMRPSLSADPEAVARFDREARATSALQSKHVARVLDVGRSPDGDPYLVMEHLVGTTLQALIAEKGPLPPDRVAAIALDIVHALTDAHAAGIIHRDLKPANVFLGETAKVLDFGIAKVDPSLAGGITTTGAMLGTPEYMAPEQLDTKRGVTVKTDVWALGVTMYNALTCKTPFEADSFYELSVKVYAHEPTPITKHRADLPPELVAIVTGCLQKDARKRLALDAVAAQLAPLVQDARTVPDGVPPAIEPVTVAPVIVDAAPTLVDPPRPRRSPTMLIAGIATSVAVILLVAAFLRLRETTPSAAPVVLSSDPVTVDPVVITDTLPATAGGAKSAAPAAHHAPPRRRVAPAPKESGALTHER